MSKKGGANSNKSPIANINANTESLKFEKLITLSNMLNTGQVHLLDLSNIKDKLGDKWPKLYDRIIETLTKKIEKETGEDSVIFSRSDVEHTVVYSGASEVAAKQITFKVLQDLNQTYLGTTKKQKVSIHLATGKINGKLVFKKINDKDISKKQSAKPNDNQSSENIKSDPSSQNRLEDRNYELIYKPIWDKKNEIISTYMVNSRNINRPKSQKAEAPYIGYRALPNPFCLEAIIEMDHFILKETTSMMNDFFENNFRAVFSIPVNYKSLLNLTRLQKYLAKCRAVPTDLQKYISFKLIDFPEGLPEARMSFIINNLLRHSREAVINCDTIPQNLEYYKSTRISGISLTIPHRVNKPDIFWEKINKFAAKCHKEKISLVLDGIDQHNEMLPNKKTNLDYLAGNVIGTYSDVPAHMAHMNWDEIVSH